MSTYKINEQTQDIMHILNLGEDIIGHILKLIVNRDLIQSLVCNEFVTSLLSSGSCSSGSCSSGSNKEEKFQLKSSTRFFIEAVHMEHIELVKVMLQSNADPNAIVNESSFSPTKTFPLYVASMSNNVEMINLLIEYKANIDMTLNTRNSLIGAILNDNNQSVRALVDACVNVESVTMYNPLLCAADCKTTIPFEILIEGNANVNHVLQGGRGSSVLQNVVRSKSYTTNYLKMVEMLLDAGADINYETEKYPCVLKVAIQHNDMCMVQLFIKNAVLLEQKQSVCSLSLYSCGSCPSTMTPLEYAVHMDVHMDSHYMAAVLIKAGADVNVDVPIYSNLLSMAVNKRAYDLVLTLIEGNADVNQQGYMNLTPLMAAISLRDECIVDLLTRANK
jgi:ankyrin repeat protein